jgi:GntR family transcriptional regulator
MNDELIVDARSRPRVLPKRIHHLMDELKIIRQPSLADQVLLILIDRIKDGVYPPGTQLPPESELIEEFSVSRATLRSAYAKLEERNLIQPRQGVGTFVRKEIGIANPLYQMIDFDDRISMQGFQPGFLQRDARIVGTTAEIANQLEIEPGSPSLRIEKIWTADEKPIIFIVNHIPLWVFENRFSSQEITQPGLTEPFFEFLENECRTPVDHLTSSLTPCNVEACDLPDEFSAYSPTTSVLVIEDIGFTGEGKPVFHSLEHLLGPASKFELIRKIL